MSKTATKSAATTEPAGMDANAIAQAITRIADATQAIYRSGLNEKAIIMLIAESSGVSRTNVKYVLSHMAALKATYLVQPKKVA